MRPSLALKHARLARFQITPIHASIPLICHPERAHLLRGVPRDAPFFDAKTRAFGTLPNYPCSRFHSADLSS
jgi:hypothetical protein